jgi:hypothetical protein
MDRSSTPVQPRPTAMALDELDEPPEQQTPSIRTVDLVKGRVQNQWHDERVQVEMAL